MTSIIESLETRQLFSASPGLAAAAAGILSDAKATRADLHAAATTLQADVRTVASSLQGLPKNAQNQKLLAKVRKDEQAWQNTLSTDVNKLVQAGMANAHKTITDAIAVFLNPTDTAAESALAADLGKLQSAVSSPLSRLQSDAASGRAVLVGDLNNLAAANPSNTSLQTASQQLDTDSQNALNTINSDTQGLQGDLTTLITNLGG